MTAYYNEFDPDKAAWLRELIAAGAIAPGDVDERDIRDIRPSDLAGYGQCHFFAGIGVWSYALRLAGWPDDRPIWTASCPCQPFSQAGGGLGFADERHLWPALFHLVRVRRPDQLFGEQVASSDGLEWIDLVHSDLEGEGYPIGAVDLCAAGVGAPNIRQRLFFMAYADQGRCRGRPGSQASGLQRSQFPTQDHGIAGGVAYPRRERRDGEQIRLQQRRQDEADAEVAGGGIARVLDNANRYGREARRHHHTEHDRVITGATGAARGLGDASGAGLEIRSVAKIDPRHLRDEGCPSSSAGPVNGFWRDAQWVWCEDGRWRPVEPGTFPLAHGASARVVRLRGYGDAINAEAAAAFIGAAESILAARRMKVGREEGAAS